MINVEKFMKLLIPEPIWRWDNFTNNYDNYLAGDGQWHMIKDKLILKAQDFVKEVFSYEKRQDFIDLARTNLMKFSQYDNVIFKNRDIKDGIDETNFDSVFLDLPNPQDYMDIVYGAMGNSSMLGVLVPTTNQVSEILLAMRNFEFKKIDVWETFIRRYKTNPYRLRPSDIMVGHTAFLIFARKTLGLGKTKLEGEEYYEQEN